MQNDLKGPSPFSPRTDPPIDLRVHALYNPEAITQYNIVPGLMGVVLTMTMVIITGLAITRERENGTMENLLSMPTRPLEVLIGKIIPYILVGYIQICLILLAAKFLFNVPMVGSVVLLLAIALIFIAANLAVGITFSTIAANQHFQAMQMSMFFFLPVAAAIWFHVPIPRHAALGTDPRRSLSIDTFSPHRSGHSAQGKWDQRGNATVLAHRALHRHCADYRC